jgi:hypothetical protein
MSSNSDSESEPQPGAAKRQKSAESATSTRQSNPWTPDEDADLLRVVQAISASLPPDTFFEEWKEVAKRLSTPRSSKQCKDRYKSKLDPSINHGPWTDDEDERLLKLAEEYPRQWSKIARCLRGRTEHAVKSRVATLARLRIKDWTPSEDDALRRLRDQGLEYDAISLHFPSRSIHSIKKRWERLYMNSLAEKIRAKKLEEEAQAPKPLPPASTAAVAPAAAGAAAAAVAAASMPFPSATLHQPAPRSAPKPLSPPPAAQAPKRGTNRLTRHSTSMTVLLQVLGEPLDGGSSWAMGGTPHPSVAASAWVQPPPSAAAAAAASTHPALSQPPPPPVTTQQPPASRMTSYLSDMINMDLAFNGGDLSASQSLPVASNAKKLSTFLSDMSVDP